MPVSGRSDNITLTGTVAGTLNSKAIVGTSTLFTTQLKSGQVISINSKDYAIDGIVDNTHLNLKIVFGESTASGLAIFGRAKPTVDDTKSPRDIYGVDAAEVAATQGISAPGWVHRRVIAAGTDHQRVLHETLTAMKSPPTENTADDAGAPQLRFTFVAATNRSIIGGNSTTFPVGTVTQTPTAYGTLTYRWQVSSNAGETYANVTAGSTYSNVTTATLGVATIALELTGNRYRCNVTSTNGAHVYTEASPFATLTVTDS